MDNYFTLPKVIKKLRDLGISVVGTARLNQGWPPKQLKYIKITEVNFNDFHWMVDQYGTLIARWMDNDLVFCISTIHRVGSISNRLRKKQGLPRIIRSM